MAIDNLHLKKSFFMISPPQTKFSVFKYIKFLLLLFPVLVQGQDSGLGSWNILHCKYVVNQKTSLFGEGQIRSLKFYDDFHYFEYKGGFTYKFNNTINFTLGAGNYQTYSEGGDFRLPRNNNELRIWPQFTLIQTLGDFKLEQRFRQELRFTSNGYRNRFRYRFGVSYLFGKDNAKPLAITFSNEIFMTNNEPYFERNRLSLSLSYKVSPKAFIQLGYIHQLDYKINDETGRDFLQIGYFLELRKKEKTVDFNDSEIDR